LGVNNQSAFAVAGVKAIADSAAIISHFFSIALLLDLKSMAEVNPPQSVVVQATYPSGAGELIQIADNTNVTNAAQR
jgi:hypothetical protein